MDKNNVVLSRYGGHMSENKDMRPVIFKGGKEFGKVQGIRGLYKDPSGRWYVRKAINGIDKQKTLDFVSENACFSVLEREAVKALKFLSKAIENALPAKEIETKSRSFDPIERGIAACKKWVETVTKSAGYSPDTVRRRIKAAENYCFVSPSLVKYKDQINGYNIKHMSDVIKAYNDNNLPIAARDHWRIMQTLFNKAINAGVHCAMNPTNIDAGGVRKPADMRKKDTRWISMDESAQVQAFIPVWCKKNNIPKNKAEELFCFHYLLTLGMRPSSAILFKSSDLSYDGKAYRYTVINHKTQRIMDNSQIIHPEMAKILKKLPVFSYSCKNILEILNNIIHEKFPEKCAKHLRKGFLTEVIASREFSDADARRLTHQVSDVVENHYYALSQQAADAVSTWWNDKWYPIYASYTSKDTDKPTKSLAQRFESLQKKAKKEEQKEFVIDVDEYTLAFLTGKKKTE